MKCHARPPSPTGETFIYMVTDGTFTKVGISRSPRERLMNLQNGNPRKLKMVYAHPVASEYFARRLENEIHKVLMRDGKQRRGEWFRVSAREANFAHLKANHILTSP
jgi:hypothetical protein